jgi:ABC-2 type transport system ATP-binding protein
MLTTHYMEEAERLCDRVAIIDHGKIIAEGTPAELIKGLHAPHIVEFGSEPSMEEAALRALPGVADCRARSGNWFVSVASLVEAVPALLGVLDRTGAKLVSLTTHRATLEDVFIALTGRELRDE